MAATSAPTALQAAVRVAVKDRPLRVCLVSHRLGGFDGVSVEAGKWGAAFQALGWQLTRAAGTFGDQEPGDVVVRGLWADRPGGQPPPVDHNTIRSLCHSHDLLVLDNAGSLWSAPAASAAWQQHALEAGIPTIVRHHDPAWQGSPLRSADPDMVPLRDPHHLHVLINEYTRAEFTSRWPVLAELGALCVVHNCVDPEALADGNRMRTRESLGVDHRDLLVAHPARVEALNKNIPGAIRFTRDLSVALNQPTRYWLTDPTPTGPGSLTDALAEAPGLIRGHVDRPADLYAAADLVVLPSTWEGWGLPVVEAAAARTLVVAGPYPVLDEIRAFGIIVHSPTDIEHVAALLGNPHALRHLLEANREATLAHLDLRELPAILADLVARAQQLVRANENSDSDPLS
jgi:mannosylglucosylglycerate synthase